MDYVSINKPNRLFWLGRYYERVALTLQYMMQSYDMVIDVDNFDYDKYCRDLGIENHYENMDDFFNRYIFDVEDYCSIRSSAEQALGNGMVLRETIGSRTLAYLQMAVYSLDEMSLPDSKAIGLGLQDVLDNMMAFRGCYDSYISDENVRNIIKCGANVERLSFCLRVGYMEDVIPVEVDKLLKRIPRTGLQVCALQLQSIIRQQRIFEGKNPTDAISKEDLLVAVENLFTL